MSEDDFVKHEGKWTRDDLPGIHSPGIHGHEGRQGADAALDAVVKHLNAHHPKPNGDRSQSEAQEWVEVVRELRRERDEWKARAEAAERVLRERDEQEDDATRAACERAEQAERQRDEDAHMVDGWKRLCAHPALRTDVLPDGATYADKMFERITWLFEAAEDARESNPAPAVTRADIKKAVRSCPAIGAWNGSRVETEGAIDAVWSLLSGPDPAVYVVRESDIAAVKVEQDGHGEWFADGEHVYAYGAEDSRNLAGGYMRTAVRRLAVARAIEAEQAVDPVEELAGQIEAATRTAIRQVCDDLATVAPSLDPLTVDRAMEVTAASRKVAAHVLG